MMHEGGLSNKPDVKFFLISVQFMKDFERTGNERTGQDLRK